MKHTDDVLPHEVRFGRPTSALRNFLERMSRPILYLALSYFLFAAFAFLVAGFLFFVELQEGESQPDAPLEPYLPAMAAATIVAGIFAMIAGSTDRGRRMWLVVNSEGVTVGYWSRSQSWNISWPEIDHVSVFHLSSGNSGVERHLLVIRPRRSTPWFSADASTGFLSSYHRARGWGIYRRFRDRGYLAVLYLNEVGAHPEVLREVVEALGGPGRYRTEAELRALDPRLRP